LRNLIPSFSEVGREYLKITRDSCRLSGFMQAVPLKIAISILAKAI